jgi:hypothetical protein
MPESFDPYYKWLGIPPQDQPANLYRLLGISLFESDRDVIENAADQRMRHVRSFQAGPHRELSQQLLNEISAARVRLLNTRQKQEYDARLSQSLAPAANVVAAPVSQVPLPVSPAPVSLRPVPVAVVRAPEPEPPPVAFAAPVVVARGPKRSQRHLVALVVGGGLAIALMVASLLVVRAMTGDQQQATRPRQPKDERSQTQVNSPTRQNLAAGGRVDNAAQLPPLQGIVEPTKFVWQRGDKPLDLGPAKDSFVVTSWFAGHFLGNGEWYKVEVDEQGNYRLRGGGLQSVGATITRVRTPYRAWFDDQVEAFSWNKPGSRVKLIHQHDGFAVLSGATGCFLGKDQAVSITLDPADGFWYLDGRTNFETQGHALVYRFKLPGKFHADVRQLDWQAGVKQQAPLATIDGLCTISGMTGRFQGYGENLNAVAEQDGQWHVWGFAKQQGTQGSFLAIRFDTPALRSLAPGERKLRLVQ